ncbi:ferric enterobactin (enterochelin)-binding protein [Cellulosimicrobium cellulans]|jgi:iron complex transport system substrate-binding protein|uniref:Ferric enterobactin (Enterochelin)-binding protein n=1 Tax=Cellulosimicrobium cellulans TaxID=1710 RepID=A0A1Y0I1A2_CELCE|nr:ABC transporter substrate-binding protein [Cellulosimicrobium cellulans]ARU53173.1 ferric enterobactin (enterochelin)-binding protein [Cellulosimicrobium cellulans]
MLPSRRPARRPLAALSVLVAAATLALAGCSAGTTPSGSGAEPSADPGSTASETAAERVVTTDQGDVTVPTDPRRVVVLNHALAGYLYALDVPVLATVPEVTDDPDPAFSTFWAEEAEADGTELIEWSADGFNLEAILALEPDLIVGGGWGFPLKQATDVYDGLSQIAPTVLVSGTYTTWQEQFAFLAQDVFDDAATYDELVAGYDERLAQVGGSITVPAGETAFLALTSEGKTFALNEGEGLPAIFERLGFAIQPIQEQTGAEPYTPGGDMFEVSAEQVTSVVSAPNVFVIGFNGAEIDVDALAADPVYAGLPSFAAGTAHELPTWTIRGDYHEAMALLDVVEEQFS